MRDGVVNAGWNPNYRSHGGLKTSERSKDVSAYGEFETIMQGYHDLVDVGKREIYKIEG